MTKIHHFVVYFDEESGAWEIGGALIDESEPLWDRDTAEWDGIHSRDDADRDDVLLADLRRRLEAVSRRPPDDQA